MKIEKMISYRRRDFTALMKCEFCGHEKLNNSGYHGRYYQDIVIPEMKCEKCGESTLSKGGEVEKLQQNILKDFKFNESPEKAADKD